MIDLNGEALNPNDVNEVCIRLAQDRVTEEVFRKRGYHSDLLGDDLEERSAEFGIVTSS